MPASPQLLSLLLRTKLGLPAEPQWDMPEQQPSFQTADNNITHPAGFEPIPTANDSTLIQQSLRNKFRYSPSPADLEIKRLQGIPPEAM